MSRRLAKLADALRGGRGLIVKVEEKEDRNTRVIRVWFERPPVISEEDMAKLKPLLRHKAALVSTKATVNSVKAVAKRGKTRVATKAKVSKRGKTSKRKP
jgi:hypothetical protein